jgi:predicted nucleotidyltransferase component of viral defense system
MSGIVNASYATINEELTITSVKERLFRGYCRDESIYEIVRAQYLELEPKLYDVMKSNEKLFEPKEFQVINKFVDDFYSILKNDKYFKTNIVMACRK